MTKDLSQQGSNWGQTFKILSPTLKKLYFDSLYKIWVWDTISYSSIYQICQNPSYKILLEFGEEIVVYLIDELKNGNNPSIHPMILLGEITGVNPIPKDARGRVDECVQLWLDWWEDTNG